MINKTIVLVANSSRDMYNFRIPVIDHLLKKGYSVNIIAPYDDYSQKLVDKGCLFYGVNINRKGSNIIEDLMLIAKLRKLYKNIGPEIIFHYTIKPNIYGSIAARLLKIPCVAVTTGLGYVFINNNLISKIARILYRFSFRFPQEVWFLNADDKTIFIKQKLVKKDQTRLLPGEGIDLNHYKSQKSGSSDNVIFVLIARLLWDKGIREYIDAARMIKQRHNNVEFQLIGPVDSQNPSAISREQVQKWEHERVVNYLGSVTDVRPYIENSTCAVLPSYREGTSRFLLECAAMERPLIAANVPGCKEIIDEAKNGFLCEAKNSKDLYMAIEKFMQLSHEEKALMGSASREKVKNKFSIDKVIQIYEEFLLSQEVTY